MISEFQKLTDTSIKYKVDYKQFTALQRNALTILGLTSMNKLRDRFEGQSFLDKFLIRSYSELALQNAIGKTVIDEIKKNTVKAYKPDFVINGLKVELICSSNDEYPIIPKGDFELGAIVLVNLHTRETYFVGTVDKKQLDQNIDDKSLSPLLSKNFAGYLKNFDIVTPFVPDSVDID
jgi:hypothetical protein